MQLPERLNAVIERPGRGWRNLSIGLIVSLPVALAVTYVVMKHARVGDIPPAGPICLIYAVISCLAGLRASRHPALDAGTRRAWRIITAGLTLGLLSGVLLASFRTAFPGPGDVVRLAQGPVLFAGLIAFPVRSRSKKDNQRLALDIGIVVSGAFLIIWYASLGPALVARGLPPQVVGAAVLSPLADLMLVVAASTAFLRGVITRNHSLALLIAGLCFWVAGDVLYGGRALHNGGHTFDPPYLFWACLLATGNLLALAAVQQCRDASRHSLEEVVVRDIRPASMLPYVAVAVGFGLLLFVACRQGLYPWGGLVFGAIVMTGCVMARQILTLRENHTLVISDHLTGLATRPRLQGAALEALSSAQRSGIPMAMLVIDMDAFKEINDTLGHDAGDAVLVAFGDLLRQTLSRTDTIARMGGDEFAVVLPAVASLANASAVVERLIAGMSAPVLIGGKPVFVRASIGIAMSDSEATVAELLHRADQAMYAAKRRHTTGWAWHVDDTVPADLDSSPLS